MQWPEGMEPEHAAVYARNEIKIVGEQSQVWKWLCRAQRAAFEARLSALEQTTQARNGGRKLAAAQRGF